MCKTFGIPLYGCKRNDQGSLSSRGTIQLIARITRTKRRRVCLFRKSLCLAYTFSCVFFIQPGCDYLPQVVVEVKKQVSLFPLLNPKHLCQLFIEGYYAMSSDQHQGSIILILRDSRIFHVFKAKCGEKSLI